MAEKMIEKITRLMTQVENIRNIGTVAHIDHGKTTFSDNLFSGAGMISKELAGQLRVLDFHEDEHERGITIDTGAVSMVHTLEGKEYLINLLDTPGHIDFSGEVTRAMRAVDGAILLVDAVEGVMPQTETVIRQCMRERVRPILFINKVDRLIKEIKLTPEAMQNRFVKIITNVNKLIEAFAEPQYKEKWKVNVNEGSVGFGSAIHNWALSAIYMKRKGLSFKDVIEAYEKETYKELAEKAPLHLVVLDMVVKHHPNPKTAQSYRIEKVWRGDIESEAGKSLLSCNPNGPVAFVCTKIVMDKYAGEVAAGRLFSGTIVNGQDLTMIALDRTYRLQQVSVYNGPKREQVERVPSGNIIGIVGMKGISAGETVTDSADMTPFESLKHLFEPVVTKSIEAMKTSDLPRLVEILQTVQKEDPSIQVEINQETGENLIHGMGELHLEIIENRIITEKGLQVKTSPPIVVYRETITTRTLGDFEGKSPNKHNKLYFLVEPMEENVRNAFKNGEIAEGRIKKRDEKIEKKFIELGYDSKIARKVKDVYKGNILIDETRGIVHIGEIIEMVMDMFEDVMGAGPITREPCVNIKVLLTDCKLHEDTIHRGPAQLWPAVREGIRGAMMNSRPLILEPRQVLQFDAPSENMGDITKLISSKRGQLLEMNQDEQRVSIKAKLPVAEMFGLASELRSATSGRGNYYLVDQSFEKLPDELQQKVVKQIRERKGLKIEE
ncbi:MAG: elongation factor EF-2 [Candidatus Woesearchaeota archaeon]